MQIKQARVTLHFIVIGGSIAGATISISYRLCMYIKRPKHIRSRDRLRAPTSRTQCYGGRKKRRPIKGMPLVALR